MKDDVDEGQGMTGVSRQLPLGSLPLRRPRVLRRVARSRANVLNSRDLLLPDTCSRSECGRRGAGKPSPGLLSAVSSPKPS